MTQYAKTRKCDLCGQRYATLNSTWHISASYRKHYCEQCTTILLLMQEKLKRCLTP